MLGRGRGSVPRTLYFSVFAYMEQSNFLVGCWIDVLGYILPVSCLTQGAGGRSCAPALVLPRAGNRAHSHKAPTTCASLTSSCSLGFLTAGAEPATQTHSYPWFVLHYWCVAHQLRPGPGLPGHTDPQARQPVSRPRVGQSHKLQSQPANQHPRPRTSQVAIDLGCCLFSC